MADGTMSGGLEILNSPAKRSDQLRSPSFGPTRQLMPVEKVSGGHKKLKILKNFTVPLNTNATHFQEFSVKSKVKNFFFK